MGAFFTAILAKIVAFAAWLIVLVLAMFVAYWLLGTDLATWVFEQILDVVILALGSIDVDFELFNPAQYIAGLPEDVTNMIGLIRVGESFAIILAAIMVRIALQLIPFTRLGS